jgi:hypothetical protein
VNPDITSENIVNLKKDIERQSPRTPESVYTRLFCAPQLRVPMLVGVGLVLGQQLTGQPVMLFYCVDIFREVADRSSLGLWTGLGWIRLGWIGFGWIGLGGCLDFVL